jgi:hypothetical protein
MRGESRQPEAEHERMKAIISTIKAVLNLMTLTANEGRHQTILLTDGLQLSTAA